MTGSAGCIMDSTPGLQEGVAALLNMHIGTLTD